MYRILACRIEVPFEAFAVLFDIPGSSLRSFIFLPSCSQSASLFAREIPRKWGSFSLPLSMAVS